VPFEPLPSLQSPSTGTQNNTYGPILEESKSWSARSSSNHSSSGYSGRDRLGDAGRYPASIMRSSWQSLNPLRFVKSRYDFNYQQVPADGQNGSPFGLQTFAKYRWPSPRRSAERSIVPYLRFSTSRMLWSVIAAVVLLSLLAGGGYRHHISKAHVENRPEPFFWELYPR